MGHIELTLEQLCRRHALASVKLIESGDAQGAIAECDAALKAYRALKRRQSDLAAVVMSSRVHTRRARLAFI